MKSSTKRETTNDPLLWYCAHMINPYNASLVSLPLKYCSVLIGVGLSGLSIGSGQKIHKLINNNILLSVDFGIFIYFTWELSKTFLYQQPTSKMY